MKFDTFIEGYQRFCEYKNGNSTSNYRVISLPNIFNNKYFQSISMKVIGIK